MQRDNQKERHARHSVNLFLGIAGADGRPARTRNVSLSGFFIETTERPTVGELVGVWFIWDDDSFSVTGRVIRHADDGIGITFVEPDRDVIRALGEATGTMISPSTDDQ